MEASQLDCNQRADVNGWQQQIKNKQARRRQQIEDKHEEDIGRLKDEVDSFISSLESSDARDEHAQRIRELIKLVEHIAGIEMQIQEQQSVLEKALDKAEGAFGRALNARLASLM